MRGKRPKTPIAVLFAERFTPEPTSGCWLWTGTIDRDGYGKVKHGKPRLAHRVSWELHRGPIPEGFVVCHRCDNPSCVNPEHLFVGTTRDNNADMDAKGRRARGERHGNAVLTDGDVLEIRRLRAEYIAKYGKRGQRASPGETTPGTTRAIAMKYGVTPHLIDIITSGAGWSHVS